MTTSSGQANTQQNSQTSPWAPAQPALQSILGNIQGLQNQSGITPTENAAIQQLQSNTGQIPNLGPTVANTAQSFLTGDPFNTINPAYNQLQGSLGGIANPNNLNPMNTPGFGSALNTLNQDITNQINGQFAAAGRSGSPGNTQALSRGLSQGEGQLLSNQYNTNVSNLMNAGNQLFTGGLGTSQALGGNVLGGAGLAGLIPGLATQGPTAQLAAGQAPFNLLAGNQGILAGLTDPIAALGGQQTGQSQTNTSQTPSAFQDLTSLFAPNNNGFSAGGSMLGFLGL